MNGKGDSPRNCFSRQFKRNYSLIKWKEKANKKTLDKKLKTNNIKL